MYLALGTIAEHLQRLDDMEFYQRPAGDWLYPRISTCRRTK